MHSDLTAIPNGVFYSDCCKCFNFAPPISVVTGCLCGAELLSTEIRRDHQPSGPGLWEQDKEVYHRAHRFMNIISIWIQLISCINLIDLHNIKWIVASRCPPLVSVFFVCSLLFKMVTAYSAHIESLIHPLISRIQMLCSHLGAINVYSWTWF